MIMYEARKHKDKVSRVIERSEYHNIVQRYNYNQDVINDFIKKNGHGFLFNSMNAQMSELEIVSQLLENFFNRNDFSYNFTNSASWSHKGDCTTLCREFKEICNNIFKIHNVQIESADGGFLSLLPQKIIHNQNVTGNMDNSSRWYFESHTWIVWNGMPIDVLFGQFGIVSHRTNIEQKQDESEQDNFFYQCGDFIFYLKQNAQLFDKYTTNRNLRFHLK